MKKALCCIVALIILVICVAPVAVADSPRLSVSASSLRVNAGDIITVDFNVSSNANLTMLRFNVNYDSSEVECVDVNTHGCFDTNNSFSGNQFIGISDSPVSGCNVLTIKFKVLKTTATISASVNAATTTEGDVTISSSSVKLSCAHGDMDWVETKKATCTAEGIETGTCKGCGHTTTRGTDMIPHTYDDSSSQVTKQPTCTTAGEQVGKCTVCGKDGAKSEIPATGHKFGDWVTVKEPSLMAKGEQRRTCSVCNTIEKREIDGNNNTEEPSTQEIPTTPTIEEPPTYNYEDFTKPDTQQGANSNENVYQADKNDDDDGDEKKSGLALLFGSSDYVSESDKAAVIVILLAVVIVIALAIYLMILQQRKKK